MGLTESVGQGAARAALFGLLAAMVSGPAWTDETQTSIGEVPLCDPGSATYEELARLHRTARLPACPKSTPGATLPPDIFYPC